jgi:hypothetical protein
MPADRKTNLTRIFKFKMKNNKIIKAKDAMSK